MASRAYMMHTERIAIRYFRDKLVGRNARSLSTPPVHVQAANPVKRNKATPRGHYADKHSLKG